MGGCQRWGNGVGGKRNEEGQKVQTSSYTICCGSAVCSMATTVNNTELHIESC